MHFVFPLSGFFLLLSINSICVNGKGDTSYNYIFDYLTNIEVKVGEKEFSHLLNYTGLVETSPYILTDGKELILLKLNINNCDGLKIKHSIIGIIIRKKGLVERIIVDSVAEIGLINLLKGVAGTFNFNEMRANKTETDVYGECDVVYGSAGEDMVIKEKNNCNKTTFHSSFPESFDSFSIYHDPKITVHYQYNNEGALIAVNSLETHLVESVLSDELSQTFKSTTALLLTKVTQSKSLISSASIDAVIKNVFGDNHKEVSLVATPEISQNEPVVDKLFFAQYRKIIYSFTEDKKAKITMELVELLRRVISRSALKILIEEKYSSNIFSLVHDAFIGCGTKLCTEIVIAEFDRCLTDDEPEANRMLLMMQHRPRFSESMVKDLWDRLPNLSDTLYDQALQTVSSMIERLTDVEHMNSTVMSVVNYVKMKLSACSDDHCLQVHLSAARNTKMPQFRDTIESLLKQSGKYSHSVMASVYSSLCSLNYVDDKIRTDLRQFLLQIVRREINFYTDNRLKYEAILCLVRLESELEDVISVINSLQNNDDHFNVFLASKFKELISMGIISDGETFINSKFYRHQKHHYLTYKDESKMLVKPLMSTKTFYSDIHFNVIGQDGGVVRNSMTDIFLVSTASENHLLSLATHINGLQSVAGTGNGNKDEVIDGLLQLVLFGKEARPIQLFHGTSELMSALWYAPSTLKSLLSGTFIPIDVHREIVFQNGVTLSLTYSGSTYLDFSFRLNSNLWYKTANSLLRVTGQTYISMVNNVKSLSKNVGAIQSLSMTSGLDFDTNIDFSGNQVNNCLSVSRSLSQINVTTVTNKHRSRSRYSSTTNVDGLCYSLSLVTNHLCSNFE